MTPPSSFFAPCPKGLESLLAEELRTLNAQYVRETRAGVAFEGTLADAYRACLWSRLASRVLMPLKVVPADDAEALYRGVREIVWSEHFGSRNTFAVDFSATGSAITHTHYGALKAKDAIVDQFRDATGERPSVDTDHPSVRVNVYAKGDLATISLDLAGESLHRRGYRLQALEAPIKENLACAILRRARWPAMAQNGGALVDLMCGAGTFLVEGAMMAADIAPGLLRPYFGFFGWKGHDANAWDALIKEAHERKAAGLASLPPIEGFDADKRAIHAARENISNAGLESYIKVSVRELNQCQPYTAADTGLVIANPPYGERLSDADTLKPLYQELGVQLKRCFPSFRAAVFTGNTDLGKAMGLRAERIHTLFNGALECSLLHFDLAKDDAAHVPKPFEIKPGSGAEMFANRLTKDLKHYGKWAKRQGVTCFRVYDADMHEYNLAVDVYDADKRYVHVQEFEAPKTVDPDKARTRLREALRVIPLVLDIPREQLFFKVRRRQKEGGQYEKLEGGGGFHVVQEGAARFYVNFTDYLDTGLFLDHRDTRALVAELSRGKHFLNLFGYTGTATVHAALADARATTTVDMSYTYLDWAERNFELNKIGGAKHELVQADVFAWLKETPTRRYDVIFLDPPTFSRSKRMTGTLDIQRDHPQLISEVAALLNEDGVLIFSTNFRKFKFERDALPNLSIEDITRRTIPRDFERDPKVHHCFRITARRG